MIDYILTPLWVFMEMFFLDVLADTFLLKKKSQTWPKRICGLLFLTMIMSVSVTLFQDTAVIKLFFDFLLAYAYLSYFYHTTPWEAVTVYLFNYSVIINVDFIGLSAYYHVLGTSENTLIFYIMCLAVKSAELGSGFLIRWIWRRNGAVSIHSKEMRALFPAFGIIVGAGVFASEFLVQTQTVPAEVTILMSGMIGLNVTLVFYMLLASRAEIEKNNLRDAALQTGMQLKIYKNKQELYVRQGKRLHEYKNQLLTISHMLNQGLISQALEYIRGLTGGMARELERIYTNHPVVDAVLNMKRQEALAKGVNINFMGSDLKNMALKEEEIIILLGNLLDNAIEAAEQCEAGRSIQVRIVQEERQLVISVKNPCARKPLLEDGRMVTTKPDGDNHGYGLAAIQDIARQHDGVFVIKEEENCVKATVLIPEP